MIRDFKKAKENLKEIADVINSFKSEAVQLRLLELVLSMEDTVEATAAVAVAPAPVAAPAPTPVLEEVVTIAETAKPVKKKKETRGRKPKPVVVAEVPSPEVVEEVKPEVIEEAKPVVVVEVAKQKKSRAKRTKKPVEAIKVSHDRPGPSVILRTLAAENYFSQTRTIGEVVKYCLATYNFKYASTDLSGTLARLVKDNILKREKNAETNQFEYIMV
jgi:hypothetical protein